MVLSFLDEMYTLKYIVKHPTTSINEGETKKQQHNTDIGLLELLLSHVSRILGS